MILPVRYFARNVLIVFLFANYFRRVPAACTQIRVGISAFAYISFNRYARTLYISIYVYVYYTIWGVRESSDELSTSDIMQGQKCKHDKADGKRALYSKQSRCEYRVKHVSISFANAQCYSRVTLTMICAAFTVTLHSYAYTSFATYSTGTYSDRLHLHIFG